MELNAVVVSVIVLCILCLCKLNVLLSMLISCIVSGIIGGMELSQVLDAIFRGFNSNAETALAYILLGTFATAMTYTKIDKVFPKKIINIIGGNSFILLIIIAGIACLSQNVVPIHIAFIPILIPPLLGIMNKMKIDRRAVGCSLAFGLEMPYIVLPVGFGLIFQGIIASNLTDNGMTVTINDVTKVNWILGIAMAIGLLIAIFISYRKPREYKEIEANEEVKEDINIKFERKHFITILAIVVTVAIQIIIKSLPFAALCGILVMIIFGAIKREDIDEQFHGGIKKMGYIAFVMLIAGGYAMVLKESGGIDELINNSIILMGGSKLMSAFIITLIGLLVTMGIGTSFGTVPILAVIYVPLCESMGFSVPATILLISAASALGDAGSPASDTTLGPTSGLNEDGQHDHIWDTCVPTFLHYNVPIMITAIVVSQFI